MASGSPALAARGDNQISATYPLGPPHLGRWKRHRHGARLISPGGLLCIHPAFGGCWPAQPAPLKQIIRFPSWGLLGPPAMTSAAAINEAGHIVGWSARSEMHRAVLWRDSVMAKLPNYAVTVAVRLLRSTAPGRSSVIAETGLRCGRTARSPCSAPCQATPGAVPPASTTMGRLSAVRGKK